MENHEYKTQHTEFVFCVGRYNVFHEMQVHAFYELYYLVNGGVVFIDESRQTNLLPHSLVIIPPGTFHHMRVSEPVREYRRCVINIYNGFDGFDMNDPSVTELRCVHLDPKERISANFEYLIDVSDKVSESDFGQILNAVLTDILFQIKNSFPSPLSYSLSSSSRESKLLPLPLSIKQYLDAHFREDISLEKIAEVFHFSVSTISHTFKDYYEISIKAYLIQKRLSEAQYEILNGNGVEKSCISCGFPSYIAFYKKYKKIFGCPPTETKNRMDNK